MTFPDVPRAITAELYVNSAWIDVSTDVYQRDDIEISRGRKNEADKPQPSSCSLTLNNRSSAYSPRWPEGPYYGSIGRNTPIRIGIETVSDTFTRTSVNSWGSADTGQAWSLDGTAADFDVAAGVGTQSIPAANGFRHAYLATTAYTDVDVRVDVSLPFTNVTGASVNIGNITLRLQSLTDYYYIAVAITTAETITIGISHFDGTVISAPMTTTLTHTSAQTLRVRTQCEGNAIRAKVWPVSGSEPYDWDVTGYSALITSAGAVGVFTWPQTGNSNAYPLVANYDNFMVTLPRFAGETSSWPQRWDSSGEDVHVPLEANGIMRRLGQGEAPLQSALKRGYLRDLVAPAIAYWPCEDGADSTLTLASALTNGHPMQILGTARPADNQVFECSDPLPTMLLSTWAAPIPAHTVTGRCQLRFLVSIPAAGLGLGERCLAQIAFTGGTIKYLRVNVDQAGNMSLYAYNAAGAFVHNSGLIAFGLNGVGQQVAVEWVQNGANVDVNLLSLIPGASAGTQLPGSGDTIAAFTIGTAIYLTLNPDGSLVDTSGTGVVAMGHVSFHNVHTSLFGLYQQVGAWIGETAGARLLRLCGEEDVPFSYTGDLDDSAAMGAQRSRTLLELLTECAEADLGSLYEMRGHPGISYRTRTSLYNQTAALDMDYTAGELSRPFDPVDDDQLSANDVTVKRTEGSEARAVLESGPMSVLAPSAGGIGRYDTAETVNVQADTQLADIAGWLLHLGTVNETRYPAVRVDLSRAVVRAAGIENSVLALEIDDRITVSNPKTGQTHDQISQLVRGYTETLNAFTHTLTLNCSPESPYRTAILDSTTYRLDSATTTLNEDMTTTETDMDVAIADGTLWTTDAGEMPFDVIVGGEVMTVTAISGASSPQTMTVTRSVNGVVKTHATGAEVYVLNPIVLAL